MVSSESQNIRTSSMPSVKHTLSWIWHSRSSLLVPAEIQSGVSSSIAINAHDISETYEDIATGKLQIRRFQRPHPVWRRCCKKLLRISRNNFYWEKLVIDLHFCRWYLSQEVLAENGFWHEIATLDDSSHSFCNQSEADKGYSISP